MARQPAAEAADSAVTEDRIPANPAHISPYSPSNRQFLNVLYIAVEDVPDFIECEEAFDRVAADEFQSTLARLRTTAHVDYVGVAAAKFEILKLLYASFRRNHLDSGSERAQAFRSFVEMQGEPLRLHAIYDALDAHLRLQGPQFWGWPSWPEDYHDPASLLVNRFAREAQSPIVDRRVARPGVEGNELAATPDEGDIRDAADIHDCHRRTISCEGKMIRGHDRRALPAGPHIGIAKTTDD